VKTSGHVEPMARPRATIESVRRLNCHHAKVKSLKKVIYRSPAILATKGYRAMAAAATSPLPPSALHPT